MPAVDSSAFPTFAAMKPWYDARFTIGLLGGGQLGRMFIQSALDFNASVAVLDPDPQAPCAQLGHPFEIGDWRDYDTVLGFGRDKDILTVEIEDICVPALKSLEARGVAVRPAAAVLAVIQDKGLQKDFYRANRFPTAPYVCVADKAGIAHLADSFFPAFQKRRRGGYDGRGVQFLRDKSELDRAFDVPSVIEKYIPFEREISAIAARNARGETAVFPVVESHFNRAANLVELLFSPADISAETEREAERLAVSLAEKLELVGILAVEFFMLPDGRLLINEMAPRPHNSGHHTLAANVTSQYEQQLRAILNLPLGETRAYCPAAMVNLLGSADQTGTPIYKNIESLLGEPDVHLHLYGKKETRPYRKMGHFTVLGSDVHAVVSRAKRLRQGVTIQAI
ncbi:MAG: 5-(carboxyamino)imidazole ribonucleotide synthase [Flavobacteriales bacterium]